jgi:AbiEi antitoxin C-terminal domain
MISRLGAATLDALPAEPFLRSACMPSGISLAGTEELLEAGLLRQPLRGVLVRSDLPDSVELRAAQVRLVLPEGAALCRATSAWLLGIDARPVGAHRRLPTVECAVPVGREPVRRPGVQCFVTDLRADDVTEIAGLPCTSPARTAIDLARWSTPGMGLAILDAMARRALIDPLDLRERVERWRGDRFIGQARRLISFCDPLAESYGESWLRLRFLDAGFPLPHLQISVVDDAGVEVYRLDLGYPQFRYSWEYDGEEFHLGLEAEAADRRRRADLERRWGWSVIGVGKNLVLGPSMTLEQGVAEVIGVAPVISRRAW